MKKYLVLFMASLMVLTMPFALPATAEESVIDTDSYYSREIPVSEWENNVTINPGSQSVVYEYVTDEVGGNTGKKLKIFHPENTLTTVTIGTIGDAANTPNVGVGYYWSFLLSDLAEGEGVKMSMDRGGNVTSFFKKDDYTFFRKMMAYNTGYAYTSSLTVTFSGKGTLYLGDAMVEIAKILNGGFEGSIADGVPGCYNTGGWGADNMGLWNCGARQLKSWVKASEEDDVPAEYKLNGTDYQEGFFFVETPENNYFEVTNATRANHIEYGLNGLSYTIGKTYELSLSCKSSTGTNPVGFLPEAAFSMPTPIDALYGAWSVADKEWSDRTWTYIMGGNGQDPAWRHFTKIKIHCNGGKADNLSYICIDNICIKEAKASTVLYDANGKEAESLIPGQTMKLLARRPVFSTTVDEMAGDYGKVTAICGKDWNTIGTNGQTSDKGYTMIMATYTGDTLLSLQAVDVKDTTGNVIAENNNMDSKIKDLGFVPAIGEFEIEVPAEGDITAKLFIWDGENKLATVGEKPYVFKTSSEAE